MAGNSRQLEFTWTSWLKRLRPRPTRRAELAHQDDELTTWCADQAKALSLLRLAQRVSVGWNPRMRSTAGRACWPDGTIELNPRIRELGEEELQRTLRHELAHLVAYERCGRRRIAPHGPEWRQACGELGIPGESPYHELPLPTRKMRRRHLYVCRHCQAELKRVRPIRRAVACYECCRKHGHGGYEERFRMVKQPLQGR